jgi:hypothetical protein
MFLNSGISLNTNATFINEGTLSLQEQTTSIHMSGSSTFQNNGWFNVSNNTSIGTLGVLFNLNTSLPNISFLFNAI